MQTMKLTIKCNGLLGTKYVQICLKPIKEIVLYKNGSKKVVLPTTICNIEQVDAVKLLGFVLTVGYLYVAMLTVSYLYCK
jgi:hypothetical protein